MCATKNQAVRTYERVAVKLYASLALALDRDEWSVSPSGRFTTGEAIRYVHIIGGWVGPLNRYLHIAKESILSLPGI